MGRGFTERLFEQFSTCFKKRCWNEPDFLSMETLGWQAWLIVFEASMALVIPGLLFVKVIIRVNDFNQWELLHPLNWIDSRHWMPRWQLRMYALYCCTRCVSFCYEEESWGLSAKGSALPASIYDFYTLGRWIEVMWFLFDRLYNELSFINLWIMRTYPL